jgi:hypothetical protein
LKLHPLAFRAAVPSNLPLSGDVTRTSPFFFLLLHDSIACCGLGGASSPCFDDALVFRLAQRDRYSHSGIMFFFLTKRMLNCYSMLPEDAKLRDLTERIRDVTINERNGLLIITMSVFLFCLGLVLSAMVNNSLVFIGGIFSSALVIFSTLLGFYVAVHYAHQYNNLQKELEHALSGV